MKLSRQASLPPVPRSSHLPAGPAARQGHLRPHPRRLDRPGRPSLRQSLGRQRLRRLPGLPAPQAAASLEKAAPPIYYIDGALFCTNCGILDMHTYLK